MIRYKDWTGTNKQKCQRGFSTRKEAIEWEAQFKLQQAADIDMTLEAFYELYEKDVRPRLKENTWMTKQVICEKKILPYLGKRKLSEITAKNVIDWQNEMMRLTKANGETFSPCYLKTIHAELSALFNTDRKIGRRAWRKFKEWWDMHKRKEVEEKTRESVLGRLAELKKETSEQPWKPVVTKKQRGPELD